MPSVDGRAAMAPPTDAVVADGIQARRGLLDPRLQLPSMRSKLGDPIGLKAMKAMEEFILK